jgi:short-subunit dehydrogenase
LIIQPTKTILKIIISINMEQALIVGGSTGMGRAIAELLIKKGVEVSIVAKDAQSLKIVESELSTQGNVKVYAVNLAKPN